MAWAGARARARARARAGAWGRARAWAGARARARARARAWARAWAGAWARAWAGAWAGGRAGAGAGAEARSRLDHLLLMELVDQAEEAGVIMWSDLVEGNCVLLECPQRWYLGVVVSRTPLTVRLSPAICGHDLGDLGLLLDGQVSSSTELTPLPRPIEVSLATLESAQHYPRAHFDRLNRRTHPPEGR